MDIGTGVPGSGMDRCAEMATSTTPAATAMERRTTLVREEALATAETAGTSLT